MVKSERLYSAIGYLKAVNGNLMHKHINNDIKLIEKAVGNELWNYPLTEIDHIVENNINVVLVQCLEWNHNGGYDTVYRWCEVPEDFEV